MNARHFLSGVALAGILASPASATSEQWLSRYAPPVNPASSVGKISQSDSAVARPEGEKAKVVIKDLKAVVFVGKPGEVRKRGATGVGVSDKSGVVPAEALAAAGAYLGRAVSLGNLDQITRDLVLAFRTADRPVVNIVVPEQEVSNGVLQVLVVVGRLAHVRVEGASPAPRASLRARASTSLPVSPRRKFRNRMSCSRFAAARPDFNPSGASVSPGFRT